MQKKSFSAHTVRNKEMIGLIIKSEDYNVVL